MCNEMLKAPVLSLVWLWLLHGMLPAHLISGKNKDISFEFDTEFNAKSHKPSLVELCVFF